MLLRKSLLLEPSPAESGGLPPNPNDIGEELTETNLEPLKIPSQPEEQETPPKEEIPVEKKVLSLEDFGQEVPKLKEEPEPPKKSQGDKRDYSMFRQEHVEILKKTPNEVFDFLKENLPKYYELENKLKQVESKQLPESWFQHKDAYVLSEDYQKVQEDFRYATFEENHWKKQLAAIKTGATEYAHLEGYDKEGRPVVKKVPVTAETLAELEIDLAQNLAAASSARLSAHKMAADIQSNWSNNVSRVVTDLKAAESKYYPFYEKPTDSQKKIMDDISGMIPPVFRNNPLASYLVKSGTLNVELVNMVKALKAEIARLKGSAASQTKIGPNGSEVTPSGGATGKVLDMAEFNK